MAPSLLTCFMYSTVHVYDSMTRLTAFPSFITNPPVCTTSLCSQQQSMWLRCNQTFMFSPGWNSFVTSETSLITASSPYSELYSENGKHGIYVNVPNTTVYATCSRVVQNSMPCMQTIDVKNGSTYFGIMGEVDVLLSSLLFVPDEGDVITSFDSYDYQFMVYANNTWSNMTSLENRLKGHSMYTYSTQNAKKIKINLCE